ncbi:hypothetical protein HYDPIDRAFT_33947 [Hydnomerulius pinastri MD-312]|uniref:Uncharacterized protein n=1 Tax=Hydnomerulius pinastri MD-312 TaxID=994086 RepID=A0A0C9V0G2_9AGAM|nr:hypothetical protein HYDPIDRAFT_33947 [Hydnomerulius pinastri MD-312]
MAVPEGDQQDDAKFQTLRKQAQHVDGTYLLFQTIEAQLTPATGNLSPNQARIPTIKLPEDARLIRSPTPFAYAQRLGEGTFFPNYSAAVQRHLLLSSRTFLPLPPTVPSVLGGSTIVHLPGQPTLPPANSRLLLPLPRTQIFTTDPSKLAPNVTSTLASLHPELVRTFKDETKKRRTESHDCHEGSEVRSNAEDITAQVTLGGDEVQMDSKTNPSPTPSLHEGYETDDSDTSYYWHIDAHNPSTRATTPELISDELNTSSLLQLPTPPHTPPSHIQCLPIFNFHSHAHLAYTLDPEDEREESATRIGPLRFETEFFDGRSAALTPPPTHSPFYPPHAGSAGQYNVLFNGRFDKHATLQTNVLEACPPSIYFNQADTYPLRVFRGKTSPRYLFNEYRRFWQLLLGLIRSVHASLTPQQSAECQDEFIYAILIEEHLNTMFRVSRADFYQHCTPSANPFLTLEEVAYLHTAVGFYRFYSQFNLTDLVDDLLQASIADEDYAHTLLLDYHLDNLFDTDIEPQSRLTYRFREIDEVHQDQIEFKTHYQDTPAPPLSPISGFHYLHSHGREALETIKEEESSDSEISWD